MRVLLAGASGAVGRYLVPQLIEAKHEVIGITRTPGSLAGTGAVEIVADVLDRPALFAALDGVKADAVIHQLTALSKSPATLRAMRPTNRLRTEGTSALIAAARRVGAKKFVAASFFGGYGLRDHGREPLAESAPFGEPDRRADAVQVALQSLEQQVRAFGGVCLRFGLFYDTVTTAVSPVSATWDGVLPMVHLSDAAAATVLALAKYRPGAVYNIADEHPLTYRAREQARAAAAGIRPPKRLPDGVLRRAAPYGALLLTRTSIALSTALAETELGWTPQFPSLLACLGADAPVREAAAIPVPAALPVVEDEAPQLEVEPETQPVAEAAEPDVPPEPRAQSEPDETPEPLEHPEPGAESPTPRDPFEETESAIARIGAGHVP
jgi:nucleoside-diphosphate-sugar epimerase